MANQASAFWRLKYETWQIETRHYGDLATYRSYTNLMVTALCCLFVSIAVLGKFVRHQREISLRNKTIANRMIVIFLCFFLAYYLLPVTTRLPYSQLKVSLLFYPGVESLPLLELTPEHFLFFQTGYLKTNECFYSRKGGKRPESYRDCHYGEASECSIASPCTPCNPQLDLDEAIMFDVVNKIFRGEHCTRCNGTNHPCHSATCKRSGYSDRQYSTAIVQGDITTSIPGWETTFVKDCSTCCTSNRTLAFFADRSLANSPGMQNIGTFKNASIHGKANSQAWAAIYAEIKSVLEINPAYFIATSGIPACTMNYTLSHKIACNESSWAGCCSEGVPTSYE